jgi:hypothetical protein
MKFTLTKSDIKKGIRGDFTSCPVVIRIKRELGSLVDTVTVHTDNILINGIEHKTPKRVVRFINKFDEGKPVEPITFELKL